MKILTVIMSMIFFASPVLYAVPPIDNVVGTSTENSLVQRAEEEEIPGEPRILRLGYVDSMEAPWPLGFIHCTDPNPEHWCYLYEKDGHKVTINCDEEGVVVWPCVRLVREVFEADGSVLGEFERIEQP